MKQRGDGRTLYSVASSARVFIPFFIPLMASIATLALNLPENVLLFLIICISFNIIFGMHIPLKLVVLKSRVTAQQRKSSVSFIPEPICIVGSQMIRGIIIYEEGQGNDPGQAITYCCRVIDYALQF
jgi:hypothetical protein